MTVRVHNHIHIHREVMAKVEMTKTNENYTNGKVSCRFTSGIENRITTQAKMRLEIEIVTVFFFF